MAEAISDTSPLLYLHRAILLDHLGRLFDTVWIPQAVAEELETGRQQGHDVPDVHALPWGRVVTPRRIPSEWLTWNLGAGELCAMALAAENPSAILLADDARARKLAKAAGLAIMGTLGLLLEFKAHGSMDRIGPAIDRLQKSGMWMSPELRDRVLMLAGEAQV